MQSDSNILAGRKMGKYRRDLKRANQSLLGNTCRSRVGNVFASVDNLPGAGLEKFGQQVEEGRFSGPVRAYQSMYGACPDVDADVTDGGKAFEILGQVPGFKDG